MGQARLRAQLRLGASLLGAPELEPGTRTKPAQAEIAGDSSTGSPHADLGEGKVWEASTKPEPLQVLPRA